MDQYLKNIRLNAYLQNVWNDVDLNYLVDNKNIADQVINFFKTESKLIYPAKSYFVAIVYSKCLEKWFKKDFYESLSDFELLPDDQFFKPYLYSKKVTEIYNKILKFIDKDIWKYKSIIKTVEYFKKEFLINGIDNKNDRQM